MDKIDDYVEQLDNISENNNFKIVCLFVTDILQNNSYLLYNSKADLMLADAFSLSEIKEGQLLKGVVSRKKQMIPPIMNVLEKV